MERARHSLRTIPDADLQTWLADAHRELAAVADLPSDQRWIAACWAKDIDLAEKELKRREIGEVYAVIGPEVIAAIKSQIDLVDLFLDAGIAVYPRGGKWRGICPWHEDTNPSLVVWPQRYKCFGCGAYGDAITFVEQTQDRGFLEAVRWLARKAGIKIVNDIPLPQQKRRVDLTGLLTAERLVEEVTPYSLWIGGFCLEELLDDAFELAKEGRQVRIVVEEVSAK